VYGIVTQLGAACRSSRPRPRHHLHHPAARNQPAAQETPPTPSTAFGGASETVLVVEDDTAMREVTRRILTRHGYQVLNRQQRA